MNSARAVTPGTGFRSLDDVPDGACVALDGRHLNYYYEGEFVASKIHIERGLRWAVVDGVRIAPAISNHKSIRRIETEVNS